MAAPRDAGAAIPALSFFRGSKPISNSAPDLSRSKEEGINKGINRGINTRTPGYLLPIKEASI